MFHQFVSEDGRRLYVKGIELRHSSCPSYRSRGPVAPLRLNVSLLRVCRQIYDEAHFIPYSTNTFSFETPRNLRAFIHYFVRRGVSVNKAFRSLRVDLIDVKFTLQAWSQAFKAVRQHMTLLDTTYVNMDQPPLWAMSDDAEQNEKDMKTLFDCLAILGKQAKSTTVVVSDEYLSGYPERLMYALSTSITQHWTVEKKRTWIAELKLTMKDLQSFC